MNHVAHTSYEHREERVATASMISASCVVGVWIKGKLEKHGQSGSSGHSGLLGNVAYAQWGFYIRAHFYFMGRFGV